MKVRFFIYGVTGWGMEVFWTGLGSLVRGDWDLSGYTYLWMLPIYGLAVFLEPLHDRIRLMPWVTRGLIWAAVILLFEYAAGWLLRHLLGFCPWDYSAWTRYTLDGLIRLDYTPVWFAAGLLFEKYHDFLDRFFVKQTFTWRR
ncbi:MAG: hypothetical protein GX295_07545 [Syntrophomonadaceae bacterium]|nr:hypothetical protein [Syntrophomonadaceae bacterium]